MLNQAMCTCPTQIVLVHALGCNSLAALLWLLLLLLLVLQLLLLLLQMECACQLTWALLMQDPVLFSGSLRSNMDPDGSWPDPKLWEALQAVQLKNAVLKVRFVITSCQQQSYKPSRIFLAC